MLKFARDPYLTSGSYVVEPQSENRLHMKDRKPGALKLLHVSIAARDADALSTFYKEVFGYVDRRPPRRLSGEKVSRGNGLPNSDIYSIWLRLPGEEGPFLEILEYQDGADRPMPKVDEPGFSHLAFGVEDMTACVNQVLKSGGMLQGEVTDFGTANKPCLIVYVRDPEGNILELEQLRG